MRLPDFIDASIETLLVEWVAFARANQPSEGEMSELALRDHASEILAGIATDMRKPQDEKQRMAKSEGLARSDPESASDTPARAHATQRARNGFETKQMVSEYRALRATVLRLWSAGRQNISTLDLEDVTRFNEAVDQALAESLEYFVAEVDRTRDLFLGMMSHDLRGPLGTISTCAQLQARSRPETTREATIILRSVAHMKALLDDLVEYARSRLGANVHVETTPLDLAGFARETLDEIIAVNPERVVELEEKGNLRGQWDAHRLHQVLSNLVFNALKYGAVDRPISVTLDGTHSDQVALTVHNFGMTIPAHILPNIFEPLVRGATAIAGHAAGANMGLGLYAAREIVRAHSGRITATSSDNDGTRLVVHLPRNTPAARHKAP